MRLCRPWWRRYTGIRSPGCRPPQITMIRRQMGGGQRTLCSVYGRQSACRQRREVRGRTVLFWISLKMMTKPQVVMKTAELFSFRVFGVNKCFVRLPWWCHDTAESRDLEIIPVTMLRVWIELKQLYSATTYIIWSSNRIFRIYIF